MGTRACRCRSWSSERQASTSLPSSEVEPTVARRTFDSDRYCRRFWSTGMRGGRSTSWRRVWGWTARPSASTPPRRGRPGSRRAARRWPRRTGATLVTGWFPELCRRRAAAGDLAGDRAAPRLHRRPAQGRGDRGDDPPAAGRRARAGRVGGQSAPVGARRNLPEEARRGPGHGAARHRAARVARRRSTTGSWGCGSTRAPGGGARCGRS